MTDEQKQRYREARIHIYHMTDEQKNKDIKIIKKKYKEKHDR